MLPVKINHLANLQDARYGAALEVAYLSFNLNPASDFVLPWKQVREMAEWLAGPHFVLDLGSPEQAESWLAQHMPQGLPDDFVAEVQLNPANWDQAERLLQTNGPWLLSLHAPELEDLPETLQALNNFTPRAHTAELVPGFPPEEPELLSEVLGHSQVCSQAYLNIDAWGFELWRQLSRCPHGLSVGQVVQNGPLELDYDAFDAYWDAVEAIYGADQ